MKPEVLIKLDLTKNEAVVYLTLLKLGESKVSEIIREANFKSGKIYQVLDSLVRKGLVSFVLKNKIKSYFAEDPEKLNEYLRTKQIELDEQEELVKNSLPALNKLYKFEKDVCGVNVFEGVEGVRTALFKFVERLSKNSTIRIYGANDDVKRDVILRWPKYDLIIAAKNFKNKIIMSQITKKGREMRRNKKNKYKIYKYLKGKDVSNFMVAGNQVLLFNFEEPNCIFIENKVHAQQFTALFDVLWMIGEKL
ncbi:TrmB family transcriptional regulator [Candidatus Woesearchaeota archaeon]|jgi:HTH-type transcriptional regulator, sugar sensing transcriptional regulator|nr:TrmB family transcriptional regulator [Candidatus Woesearchaeota archaeon]MBT6518561.1 TrmB family transcriptional regulator [Candidatus Woesearchaeota archaeon]MBT7366903.1 TrmB family transcriptional regulator [Candidatus Woesearchaeota archaeon]